MSRTRNLLFMGMVLAVIAFFGGTGQASAETQDLAAPKKQDQIAKKFKKVTPSERKAAAARFKALYEEANKAGKKK